LGFPELIVICSIVLHIWLLVPHELLLLLPTFFFGDYVSKSCQLKTR